MVTIQRDFKTIADVRAANMALGHHFFDRASLRFFDSKIGRTVYGGRYFVTSEQFHDRDYHGPRKYTVREIAENGSIDTVYQFQAYATAAGARHAIKALIADEWTRKYIAQA